MDGGRVSGPWRTWEVARLHRPKVSDFRSHYTTGSPQSLGSGSKVSVPGTPGQALPFGLGL